MRRIGAASVAVLACTALSCIGGQRPPLPTIAGPEATELVASTHGYVVAPHRAAADGSTSEIMLTAVPSLVARVIRPPREGPYAFIRLLSGPDDRGRVAYVQSNGWGDTARLNVIDADGRNPRVIATAVGDEAFGAHLALAPVGGAVAFMGHVRKAWPGGKYVSTGTLSVWRPETNRVAILAPDADDTGIAWFPDGDHLAYVERVPASTFGDTLLGRLARGTPECEGKATTGQVGPVVPALPVVYVMDVRTGARRPLHVGTNPVVSTDGAAVLLECGSAILVDTAGQRPRAAPLPGDLQRPLALVDGHLAVYWGLPTEGAPVVRSPYGSFGAGTQAVTIKIADIATQRFQTIIPVIDPRDEASFGRPGAKVSPPDSP